MRKAHNFIDLTGQKFGKLTVINRAENKVSKNGRKQATWNCICDCGKKTIVSTKLLRSGKTQSCGCLQKEVAASRKFIDISGKKFGKLRVIEPIGKTKFNEVIWKCQCDCGKITETTGINLRKGHTKSCGCLRKERIESYVCSEKTKETIKNGNSSKRRYSGIAKKNKRLYRIWTGMKTRCYNPKSGNYKYYGAKGVTVCEEWKNDFQSFYDWAMTNGYKDTLTLDRKNNNEGYYPANCKWSTMKEQAQNTSQTSFVEYNGSMRTFSELSEISGISKDALKHRVKIGWSVEKALTTPVRRTLKK